MHWRWLIAAGMAWGLLACQRSSAPLPISEDKLVDILVDVHIAEAAMQNLFQDTKDSVAEAYYQQIFQIHQVSEESFKQAVLLIREDPDRLKAIYASVIEKLENQESSF